MYLNVDALAVIQHLYIITRYVAMQH